MSASPSSRRRGSAPAWRWSWSATTRPRTSTSATRAAAADKLGIFPETLRLPARATTAEVLAAVTDLNRRADIHGILVQLPLPPQVDERASSTCRAGQGRGRLPSRQRRPPGAEAAALRAVHAGRDHGAAAGGAGIELAGRRAVVLGRSDIVGKPMALLLLHADATVTVCHSRTRDLADVTREADILVAAIGKAALVRAEHVKPGAVVVDVGINRVRRRRAGAGARPPRAPRRVREEGARLVGDVHAPSVLPVAGALTPVPGGVGPLTIAMLLANTVRAADGAAGGMLRVGLTGGIASGKSHVLRRLAGHGLHTLDLDAVARNVTVPGSPALQEISGAFGAGVLGPDGSLDRAALAAVVFTDAGARARLNAIVHPRVRARRPAGPGTSPSGARRCS